jgi:drug/metabolite transporter (DMT)-like permease
MNGLLAIGFVLCWSSGFIGAKLGTGSADAVTVLMWRFLPLAVILAVVAAVLAGAAWRALTARTLGRQAVIGLLSQGGYVLTVYYAIQLGVSTGTTALIDGTQPLVAGVLAGPLLRQYVSPRQWLVVSTKEASVGLLNGVAVAITCGLGVDLWSRSIIAGFLSFLESRRCYRGCSSRASAAARASSMLS